VLCAVFHASLVIAFSPTRHFLYSYGSRPPMYLLMLVLACLAKGPFPGVLLIPGSGVADKNETLGLVHKSGPNPPTPLLQIAQYLSERGFAVLRYDKRGVGANHTISDTNVWGNVTANDLIQDSKKALNVLMQQPEVDPKRISIIGHSEGTLYAPRVAIDNLTKVKNIILMERLVLLSSRTVTLRIR